MAATGKADSANVSVGKGVAGGYMFVAPAGTTLPEDNKTELDAKFVNMGYLGEDGISFSDSSSNDKFVDMNGDPIDTTAGEVEKSFTVKFNEVKKDTWAIVYGAKNVRDASGVLEITDNGPSEEEHVAVFELLLKNGRKWRRIVPRCKLGETGDWSVVYSELVAREVTFTALKDGEKGYYKDYIDSTETSAAMVMSEDEGDTRPAKAKKE